MDFDTSQPSIARMYDYFLAGKDNFAADREAAEKIISIKPETPLLAQQHRAFLRRVVRYLAAEARIRQFLDIGSGLPSAGNVHEVAQQAAPTSRVVYVDHDPVVMRHAQALLNSTPEGACAYVQADLHDPEVILGEAARTLDFSQPVAVLLFAILHFIPDEDDPHGIVAKLMEAVPSGSYLAVSHVTPAGLTAEEQDTMDGIYARTQAGGFVYRTPAAIGQFLAGQDLVNPGLTPVPFWRPVPNEVQQPVPQVFWGAVGRQP